MSCKLRTVLQKGIAFDYEYDFGSATELAITVRGGRKSFWRNEKLTILSRNNPPEFLCDKCHGKAATVICAECMYEGTGFLCDECGKTYGCSEDMQLTICNSPGMGVCAYEGSSA